MSGHVSQHSRHIIKCRKFSISPVAVKSAAALSSRSRTNMFIFFSTPVDPLPKEVSENSEKLQNPMATSCALSARFYRLLSTTWVFLDDGAHANYYYFLHQSRTLNDIVSPKLQKKMSQPNALFRCPSNARHLWFAQNQRKQTKQETPQNCLSL